MNEWFQFGITEKPVENVREIALGNARPVILDIYYYILAIFRYYSNPYIRAWRILNSIVDYIFENLAQSFRITADECALFFRLDMHG